MFEKRTDFVSFLAVAEGYRDPTNEYGAGMRC